MPNHEWKTLNLGGDRKKNAIMTLAKVEILEQDTVQKQGRVASRFLLKPSTFRLQRVTVKEQKGKARQCVCSRSGSSTEVAHCLSVLSRTVALVINMASHVRFMPCH